MISEVERRAKRGDLGFGLLVLSLFLSVLLLFSLLLSYLLNNQLCSSHIHSMHPLLLLVAPSSSLCASRPSINWLALSV